MFELQYFLIGMIQGVTEFLPISSSGHLVLFAQLTNWGDQGLFTDIAVHFGTLVAVIIYLRQEIINIFKNFFQYKSFQDIIIFKIIFATLPAIVVGFFIYNYIEDYFRSLEVVAWASIFFGIILFFADKKKSIHSSWNEINFKHALIIGIFQILAFIPGASRSGVTITGARFLGLSRRNAAIFSMLLSIPIILASLILSLFDILKNTGDLLNINQSLFASVTAFFTAIISIHFMMNVIQKTNFNLFIFYRISLGFVLLYFYA
tara:strand:- start:8158 stop:8943 length:786 start_codon:yes stop_codon:yes gene_type:complete